MCKNLLVINLSNEGDDLVLEKKPTISTGVRYSKSKQEKNSTNIAVKALTRQNGTIPQ